MEFFATTGRGLEPLLADELRALGAEQVREGRGGVAFAGELRIGYAACLWSRTANRILLPLARFPAATPEELYAGVRAVDWAEHLSPDGTLAVDFVSSRSAITHTQFGAQKAKDAVVDRLRDETGRRPSVRAERPDLQLNVYVHRDEAQLALDLSGESLHRRGYRQEGTPAPLKENLAAALLLRAGWPALAAEGGALLDPMCGSGTLLIEGALIAGDTAPGLLREYFGFLGWLGHVPAVWRQLREEALARREAGLARLPRITGYDVDAQAVRVALTNVERAGLQGKVHIERRSLSEAQPLDKETGLFIVNPPYGERLGDATALIPLYGQIGDLLKQRFGGWQAAVFTGNPELGLRVGLKPRKSYQLFNGPIECRLSLFDIAVRPPAEEQPQEAGGDEMLANRLRKNLRNLSRWAKREGVTNYRLYDADLPEYAVAVDLYQGDKLWVHVQEYAAPASVDAASAGRRLRTALRVIPEVLDIPAEQMFFKVRERQRGRAQYEKLDKRGRYHEVREGDCRLLVNFTDYLDTGLFLDHRPTRTRIGQLAQGKRFLNLFCYTGAASVHAAVGGASSTTSVDMSRTYLDWAERNLALNGFRGPWHELIQADCLSWLAEQSGKRRRQYDLIFLDPPSFSNSKRMQNTFDVQRDHVALLRQAASLLAPDGLLIFSNNLRRFRLDADALPELDIRDITRETIPPDFARNPKVHHCFEIRRR
ncbi:MAG TPA: bifunctional 23S rRNA (guanine(2069)-N(7))-methyltransferase RlmK/23S rRNA (guanine(2445)-N(2))-methyltransferase RlmL [Gammaproteobacteria bacterium]|nr:bifunctional 23S rRNA (guanine(2069)-N(7))-methyltransferase RlmK/23S rRNA (guanine(2445)-N(2))-methyltransferase RlmL [Gammaproteobacteria bacterium]